MIEESDKIWEEFFHLMMSSYKMEMRPPKEYTKKELSNFNSKVAIFASDDDIFFPADKVFNKSDKILKVVHQEMRALVPEASWDT